MPRRNDIHRILIVGSGPDRHRPGLRIRLLRHAGVQSPACGRVRSRSDQFEPGDDHDGPGPRRSNLRRAVERRIRRRSDPARAPGCAAIDRRRPDRTESIDRPRRSRSARQVRRRVDRRQSGFDQEGRRPAPVQGRHAQDRPRDAAIRSRQNRREGARVRGADRISADPAAELHARGHGRRHRLQPRRTDRDSRARARPLTGPRSPARGERARLEGIRTRGHARPRRQRHHRLLHREFRSDGRPYRRFDHHRSRADAHGPRVPDDAGRAAGVPPRDRRGYRRIQRSVRHQSGERPHGHRRNESSRFAEFGFGVEGYGLPDREDRCQAGRRLPARRNQERHHGKDSSLLRADHRLRGGQNSALAV